MTSKADPYVPASPGDAITSEAWNDMQKQIKQDLAGQIGGVQQQLDTHIQAPIDADTFGGKTPEAWKEELDEQYVQHSELQSGWGEYRRYFKQVDDPNKDSPLLIEHNLQRYPMINVFQLDKLQPKEENVPSGVDKDQVLFLVYYAGARDQVAKDFLTDARFKIHWGDPLTLILEQFGMSVTPTQLFDDVLNDLWGKMFDPALGQDYFDRSSFGHSKYIQEQVIDKDRTVADLQSGGMWEDLRMAIRPRMISPKESDIKIYHLSQNMLEIEVQEKMDLMILLRT